MKMKRIVALFLCLLMALSLFPLSIFAEETEEPAPAQDPAAEEKQPEEQTQPPLSILDDPLPEEPAAKDLPATGYYVVGDQWGWNFPQDLDASRRFGDSTNGEYSLRITLDNGNLKVIHWDKDTETTTWYPGGDNYYVSDDVKGKTTIYFRPDYTGGDDWHEHCIYILWTKSIVCTSHGNGTVTADLGTQKASGGYKVTLTLTPDAGYVASSVSAGSARGSYPVERVSATQYYFYVPYGLDNTDTTIGVDAYFTAAPTYTVQDTGMAPSHGTAVIQNADNETVTGGNAGDVLHVSVSNVEEGWTPVSYIVRQVQYYSDSTQVTYGMDETFTMPAHNCFYHVNYRPAQSGYYWVAKTYSAPLTVSDLDPSRRLTQNGSVYSAPITLSGSGFIFVRYYDAAAHTLADTYFSMMYSASDAGNVILRLDPDAASDNLALAHQHTITRNVIGSGTLTVAESAYTGDSVSVTAAPAAGNRLSSLTVTLAAGGSVAVNDGAFVMPDADVTVSAVFVEAGAIADGFYISNVANATVDDLTSANRMISTEIPAWGTYTYTADLAAGTWYLYMVKDDAIASFYFEGENCVLTEVTAYPFTVAASGTQTVYMRAEESSYVNVFRLPACLSLTGLYCWNCTIHDWSFTSITAADAFVLDDNTGLYAAGTALTHASYVAGVQFANGSFVRSYPANAFTTGTYYVADGDVFGYGNSISATVYLDTAGSGSDADGWQHGCLRAERQFDVIVNAAANGTVDVSKSAGNLIGLTMNPASGYALSKLTVLDANGDPVSLTPGQGVQGLFEFQMPPSDVYVTAEFSPAGDFYVYTETMADSSALPTAAYKMDFITAPDATGAYYGFYRFLQMNALVVGDRIHIVKVENGAITAHYPAADYWMELTEDNLDDMTTGTEIGFRPQGFYADARDPYYVYEDGSGDFLFYKCTYITVIVPTALGIEKNITHGSITGPDAAQAGSAVELVIVPDDGCTVNTVTLVGDNGAAVPFTRNGNTISFKMPTVAVTCTVTMNVPTVTVTFETYGGTPVPEDQVVEVGESATRPETDPQKEGSIFGDWYADAAFTAKFNFNSSITQDTTVYAKFGTNTVQWVIAGQHSRIITDVFTGNAPAADSNEDASYWAQSDMIMPQGSSFAGWKTETDQSGNVTYTAQFSFPVTLHTNGGTIHADDLSAYIYGAGAMLPAYVTKAKHAFGGWFDNEGLTGTAITAIGAAETGSREYWAMWTPVYAAAATVAANNFTYDAAEHPLVTVTGEATGGAMRYALGTDATTAPASGWSASVPTATDVGTYYVWYKVQGDDDHFDSDAAVVTVTVTKIIVSFEENGGSEVDDQIVPIGGKAVRPEDPTRLGYDFVDWYADEGCTEVFDFETVIEQNTAVYALWESVPFPETLTFAQDYLLLLPGETFDLEAVGVPRAWLAAIVWSSDNEAVATVDDKGTVTAVSEGVAWIMATLDPDSSSLTALCRIDVTDEYPEVTAVRLVDAKATTNIYSTDYTRIEVLPELLQNHTADRSASADERGLGPVVTAIESARFADAATAAAFDLRVVDDRTLEIVPKDEFVQGDAAKLKTLKSSYKSAVIVTIGGREFTTPEMIQLSVKKTKPRITAKIKAFNSFIPGDTQAFAFSGGVPETVVVESAPAWLSVDTDALTAAYMGAVDLKLKDKVILNVKPKGWAFTTQVTVNVSVAKTAPKFSLSPSTVQLKPGVDALVSAEAALGNVDPKLQALSVVSVMEGKNIVDDALDVTIDGSSITVRPGAGAPTDGKAHTYKVTLALLRNGMPTDVTSALTVKLLANNNAVSVTAKAAGAIDTAIPESPVTVTLTVKNANAASVNVTEVTVAAAAGKAAPQDVTDRFDVEVNGLTVTFRQAGGAALDTSLTYTATIRTNVGAAATVKLTVKTNANPKPTVTLKAAGAIDVIRPDSAVTVTPTVKDCFTYAPAVGDLKIWKVVGKNAYEAADDKFDVRMENGVYVLTLKPGSNVDHTKDKFAVSLSGVLDGTPFETAKTNISVKMGSATVNQSAKSVMLLKDDRNSRGSVTITVTTAGVNGVDWDKTLASIVIPVDKNNQPLFEVERVGEDIVIRFANSELKEFKSATVKVSVFLLGNNSTKPNKTLSISVKLG